MESPARADSRASGCQQPVSLGPAGQLAAPGPFLYRPLHRRFALADPGQPAVISASGPHPGTPPRPRPGIRPVDSRVPAQWFWLPVVGEPGADSFPRRHGAPAGLVRCLLRPAERCAIAAGLASQTQTLAAPVSVALHPATPARGSPRCPCPVQQSTARQPQRRPHSVYRWPVAGPDHAPPACRDRAGKTSHPGSPATVLANSGLGRVGATERRRRQRRLRASPCQRAGSLRRTHRAIHRTKMAKR